MHKIYKKVILAAIALLFMVSSGYALPSQFANVQWPQTSAEEEAEAYAALLGSSFEPKINVTQMRPRHSSVKKVKLSPRKPSLPNHKVFKLPESIIGLRSSGAIQYYITVGSGQNFMEVKGVPDSVAAIRYQVKNGILRLYYADDNKNFFERLCHPRKYSVQVYLNVRKLNQISQHGVSSVSIHYSDSQPLKIKKWGQGPLKIKGHSIRLSRLENNGSGEINISRIYSNNLVVLDNGNGKVVLTGSRINLRELKADNRGFIAISNIKSSHLILDINTGGIIKLTGEVAIANISFSGSGNLQLYWVKSNDLTIDTHGSGTLALAGTSKIVNAYAGGRSHLDLRYLRAGTVFITTYHLASADVWANNNLYALAENNSNIYYYSNPNYMSRMMRQSGSILPMSDIRGAILAFNTKGSIKN